MWNQLRLPGTVKGRTVQVMLEKHNGAGCSVGVRVWLEGAWVPEGFYDELTEAEAADVVQAVMDTVWT